MLITMIVVIAWFAGLLFMFSGFERTQQLKSGTLIINHEKRNKFVFGLSVYLVLSMVLLGFFITAS